MHEGRDAGGRQGDRQEFPCDGDDKKRLITVSPTAADFDKNESAAGYANLTFALGNLDEGQTVAKLFLDEAEIEKSGGANWNVSNGNSLVIKKAYLATLSVGAQVFTAETSDGGTVSFTVNVTDST